LLEDWPAAASMQLIARDLGAPVAAFVLAGDTPAVRYFIRDAEIDFAGHASLAVAHMLFHLAAADVVTLRIATRKREFVAGKGSDGGVTLRLPAMPFETCEAPAGLLDALGLGERPIFVNDNQYFIILRDAQDVAACRPDFGALMRVNRDGVIITAAGRDCDFVSRAFAPKEGLDEDPVCGSAHLALAPYWSAVLGKADLRARQISARAGELGCRVEAGTVDLTGHSVLFLEGRVHFAGRS
jgi:PhzF family phenazine biosynthesis protein